MKQTIVWTLLPDPQQPPTADGTVPLSLVLGPRLTVDAPAPPGAPPPQLSDFPQIADLPELGYTVSVVFRKPTGESEPQHATFVDGPLDVPLWRALFPLSTAVHSFQFDASVANDPIESYPARPLAQSLRDTYGTVFVPTDADGHGRGPVVPDAGQTAGAAERWEALDRLVAAVDPAGEPGFAARMSEQLRHQGVLPDDLAADPYGWARLAAFHTAQRPAADGSIAGPQPPERDFHGLVAALADHPGLMAPVGLLRRLTVPLPADLPDGPLTIQAQVDHAAFLEVFQPVTSCIKRSGKLFLARADGISDALYLPLDDTSKFTAHDLDIDSAGLALQSYAATLRRLPRTDPPPQPVPPALRSDGIFVAQADRQVAFREALEAADGFDGDLVAGQPGDTTTVNGDNVLQGYRVDVCDVASGHWYPLCRRAGAYTVRGYPAQVPIDDEAAVGEAITRLKDSDGRPVSRLNQSVFRWSGWSLAVAPPGRTLGLDGTVQDPGPVVDPQLPFASQVRVPDGTLPSLRYGRSYRFRARLVDLAGRSAPFTAQPDPGDHATAPLRYTRYEPVSAAVLVARRPVTEGESVAVLVVRTDNADPSAPVARPPCERHLLPPKVAVQQLERHGVLDTAGQHRTDAQVYALLKQFDGGALPTGPTDENAGGAPYLDMDQVQRPWLPDPFARGLTLRGLPGQPDVATPWPHGTAWHEQFPVRLVVEPGPIGAPAPPPAVDLAARVVRVALAPGATGTALLSSVLAPGDEEDMGLWWAWLESANPTAAQIAAHRADALAGRIGELTPPVELRMIHAVRCPVVPPAFVEAAVVREPGATAYLLADPALTLHDPSTLSVHAEARWHDVVDDTAQPDPVETDGYAVLRQSEQDIRPEPEPGAPPVVTAGFQVRHDVGDTRHHVMSCTPIGTSRFAPYFTERRTVRLTGTDIVSVAPAFVPGTVVVRAVVPKTTGQGTPAEPAVAYSIDDDVVVLDAEGMISRTQSGAIADGQQVEVAYVVPPVTRAGLTAQLHVPASVRPPAPAVHSVVPAFRWEESTAAGQVVSTRHEGSARVYLERPWYVSGEGEMLAVMVAGSGAASPDTATTWGRDPVREVGAGTTAGFPGPSDLHADATVPLPAGTAMGYAVQYDCDRHLWYADVQFAGTNLYEPFVRLKVARLQQNALLTPDDLRLSPVVDAGFVKIPAFRRTTVTLQPAQTGVDVAVIGPAPPPGADGLLSTVTAEVQVRNTMAGPAGEAFTWQTLDNHPAVELCRDVPGVIGRWEGPVVLPVAPDAHPMRVLVREYEQLPGPDGLPAQRITYLDTLPVPGSA
ncbi:hypothetical protein AB0M29_17755 [Streptomyces sp. NPDC051976]|uniref:hypothetical protein n=1 Tax=Streptomyces sp. NPDC051976 TaxID=3154947 RepID=UPI003437782E